MKRFALVVSFLAFGCWVMVEPPIGGSGVLASEVRSPGAFSRVSIESGIAATVAVGPRSVTLRGDDNLLALVETWVHDGTLVVRHRTGVLIMPHHRMEVAIVNDLVEAVSASGASTVSARATPVSSFRIQASGASEVTVSDVSAQEVVADASGASRVTVAGNAASCALLASGASTVVTRDISAVDARVDLSGASQGRLRASRAVTGTMSGASHLQVDGPATIDVALSGGSTVARGSL